MYTLHDAANAVRASDVAAYCKTEREGIAETQRIQVAHRVEILKAWLESSRGAGYDVEADILASKTLDIGCGQGDMTATFAVVLKEHGDDSSMVIGVDPARLDYGAPFTIGQAQEHLASGALSKRLSFKKAFVPDLVSANPGVFSTAIFVHSLYYLPSAATIVQAFRALRESGVKQLLLAEWALSTSRLTALPHLLAVLLQSVDPLSEGNVRTVLSPTAYINAAKEAGWELVASKVIQPPPDLEDGAWEFFAARSIAKSRQRDEETMAYDERAPQAIRSESVRAHAAAMESSVPEGGPSAISSMDTWTAVFKAG